ncbi:MAG: hypothetical protein LBI86_00130 [Treponema sp.]|jgi:hypothetical protein|nr:hypothetical protein [Treponema sp.]
MGVYCQMLADEKIMKSLEGVKKALVLTCPGCACESLSYDKGLPNRSLNDGKGFENIAVAVHKERDRIKDFFSRAGIKTNTMTVAFPCELVETDCRQIVKMAEDVDAVCVLACTGGFLGIRDILAGCGVKIAPLMRSVGTFVFHIGIDDSGNYTFVERENARILRFSTRESGRGAGFQGNAD